MSAQPGIIYLDHNATAPVSAECIAAALACMRMGPVNPSSKHRLGEGAQRVVREARAEVARLLGAAPAEVVFTSGGTESNALAIRGALALCPGTRHLVTRAVGHPSTLMLVRALRAEGLRVTVLPVDGEGRPSLEALEETIGEDTALVSLMWANNETGVLSPLARIAEITRARGVLLHTDAVQAVGRVPVELDRVPVDLLSLSGHKLGAPPGVGALFVRKGLALPPLVAGHQERGRRGGTENVPGIAALGAACATARAEREARAGHERWLRERLEAGLRAIPGAAVNGADAERLPNTTSVRFAGVLAEALLARLDRAGVCASAGAACAAGVTRPSHVLLAMGLDAAAAQSTIRLSLGPGNTAAEIDVVLALLAGIARELRQLEAGPEPRLEPLEVDR